MQPPEAGIIQCNLSLHLTTLSSYLKSLGTPLFPCVKGVT